MTWLIDSLIFLLGLLLVFVLLVALFAPLEALSWWAGWSRRDLRLRLPASDDSPSNVDTRPDESCPACYYIVYLTGILAFSGQEIGQSEVALMENIAGRLPGDEVVIGDVFPYSVVNNPLNGERLLRRLWQWLKDNQRGIKNPANPYNWLILLRNLFQVAVSSDPRYGPIYNVGVAAEITRSLLSRGYQHGSGKPVFLVGYSGGAQISVGAAPYLREALDAPIYVIGLGGFFTSDRGIASVAHLYNIMGRLDFVAPFGWLLFPGRWPLFPGSAWNHAHRQGRMTTLDPGPVLHFGRRDYFSQSAGRENGGEAYADRTARLVAQAILEQLEAAGMDGKGEASAG